MPDKEGTITHLQIINTWAEFARERDLQFFTAKHMENIAQWTQEAISLLKDQEPVSPEWRQGEAFCGACGRQLPKRRICKADFCPGCGKRVKWE